MLRNRLDMSRMAGRLLLQVAVSVTATLIGSALFAALPNLALPGKPAAVELTSGGKYAARIPGVAAEPVELAAADPVVATAPSLAMPAADALEAIGIADAMATSDLSLRDGSVVPAIEKPARGKPRVQRTGIVRHAADLAQASGTARPAGLSAGDAAIAVTAEDGVLNKAMSSARSLWSLSASAGGALLSHLTP